MKFKVGDKVVYNPKEGDLAVISYKNRDLSINDIVTIRAVRKKPYKSYGFHEIGRLGSSVENGWDANFVERDFDLVTNFEF